MQVRLLRALQDKTYEPLGAEKSLTADVRFITATNRDINQLVEDGTFRQDLFYRINVVRLQLPPLRERKEDIPLLIESFITRFNHLLNRNITGVSREVLGMLLAHDYPGNVRELENILEHAFVLCPDGRIGRKHLPQELQAGNAKSAAVTPDKMTFRDMEKIMISDALRRNHWNRSMAARELGIHKSTLFRKIKDLDISIPPQDGRSRKQR